MKKMTWRESLKNPLALTIYLAIAAIITLIIVVNALTWGDESEPCPPGYYELPMSSNDPYSGYEYWTECVPY